MTKQLYVIVQAGGRGSRLRHHTWNKPKCLVSVNGKPILYHLFDHFANAKFIVIGDYLYEQLEKYLQVNPPSIEFQIIKASGKGTATGIAQALEQVPSDCPVVVTWSDLKIHKLPPWPSTDELVICTTSAFTCRWTINENDKLEENPGTVSGIPGVFYASRASSFPRPPESGEFVKWLSGIEKFSTLDCSGLEELGDFAHIELSNERDGFSRFFNKVDIKELFVEKTVIDNNYDSVHKNEIAWYESAKKLGFRRIPKVFKTTPLIMERIIGHHAYQLTNLTIREQGAVLADYLDTLLSLHDKATFQVNKEELREVYITKTKKRVLEVAKLIPNFEQDSITINGKKCRNVFAAKHEAIWKYIDICTIAEKFTPIHGDPTFSNTIIDDKLRVWFIDPRGYFAKPGIAGDPAYDFAKLYYSAVGNYDAFNRRKFKLYVDTDTAEVLLEESIFKSRATEIFKEYFEQDLKKIQILHALIWLALTGYAKDDLDSAIGAFYLGLYWLEMALD